MNRPLVVVGPGARDRSRVALAFGAALRAARRERRMSQERLALLADCDKTYTGLLERGRRTPTLTVLFRLAQALDIEPAQLVTRAETELKRYPW
jgi:transcriptional regulator with XRE-family HTH domain